MVLELLLYLSLLLLPSSHCKLQIISNSRLHELPCTQPCWNQTIWFQTKIRGWLSQDVCGAGDCHDHLDQRSTKYIKNMIKILPVLIYQAMGVQILFQDWSWWRTPSEASEVTCSPSATQESKSSWVYPKWGGCSQTSVPMKCIPRVCCCAGKDKLTQLSSNISSRKESLTLLSANRSHWALN